MPNWLPSISYLTFHSIIFNLITLLLSQFLFSIPRSGVQQHSDARRRNSHPDNNIADTEPIECYACTQVGIPVFHSTTCDYAHPPEWEALAGSSLFPTQTAMTRSTLDPHSPFGRVLDPRSQSVQCWNRVILLTRGLALAVDPLFFFAMSINISGRNKACIYMGVDVAAIVSVLRTCLDAVQLCHVWLQFRLGYVPRESLVVGCGKLVWDARAIAKHYVRSLRGLWFDVFVILPIPQIVYWLVVPKLLSTERTELTIAILQFIFLLQFLPKVYHCFRLMHRMRKVTGYIFGTIWWGFALNLTAYFLASHAAGGYWYILALRRIVACLKQQCDGRNKSCSLSLSYPRDNIFYCNSGNSTATTMADTLFCLDNDAPFPYGIYRLALPVMSSNSIITKILYSNLWGLMALSTMGNNLEPTSRITEVIFSICMVLAGLVLFTLLIGNIQVFLHAVMVRRRKMELRHRDMEWWMKRRQLPSHLRQRVRHFENQRWATMGGQDEMELIKDLPDGLRRDIKRYLCLDLIKKVPLFHSLDDVILDNICDRVKPLIYSKDEKVIREGDPVKRMVFIVNGTIKRSQGLSKGMVATGILEPGAFLGDELFSWCLHHPFVDRLPASSATFTCVEATEAYGLDAEHLRYITDHFRYNFANEKLKRRARYYSSNWRTWAAVNIQLAWRRYVARTRGLVMKNGGSECRMRHFAAMFMSLKPHDHLE